MMMVVVVIVTLMIIRRLWNGSVSHGRRAGSAGSGGVTRAGGSSGSSFLLGLTSFKKFKILKLQICFS